MTKLIPHQTLLLAISLGLILPSCAEDARPATGTNSKNSENDEDSEDSKSEESEEKSESGEDEEESDSGDEESESQNYIIDEEFEDYDADSPIAEQAGDPWTTWVHTPGDAFDPMISDKQAKSGDHAVHLTADHDLVALLGALDEGKYEIDFQIFVEKEKLAYFNILQVFWTKEDVEAGEDPATICKWGVDVYFNPDGNGIVAAAGTTLAFEFKHEQWIRVNAVIDLDKDEAVFSIDEEEIHNWTWSSGTQGGDNSPTLGGINWYGAPNQPDGTAAEPSFYFDNLTVKQLESSDSDDDDDDDDSDTDDSDTDTD